MENLKIKLASGKIVTLEAFHMSRTYGCLITGKPNKEINTDIINNISYPSNWGKRKAVFNKSDLYISEDVLKPIVYSAWLSSKSINDKDNQFDGSDIVVIWFGDSLKGESIDKLIVSILEELDWDKNAENFLL